MRLFRSSFPDCRFDHVVSRCEPMSAFRLVNRFGTTSYMPVWTLTSSAAMSFSSTLISLLSGTSVLRCNATAVPTGSEIAINAGAPAFGPERTARTVYWLIAFFRATAKGDRLPFFGPASHQRPVLEPNNSPLVSDHHRARPAPAPQSSRLGGAIISTAS